MRPTGATMNPVDRAIFALEAAEKRFSAIDSETNDEVEILCRTALQALRDKEFVCVPRELDPGFKHILSDFFDEDLSTSDIVQDIYDAIVSATYVSAAQPKE